MTQEDSQPGQDKLNDLKKRARKTQKKSPSPKGENLAQGFEDVVLNGESSREFANRIRKYGWNSMPGVEGQEQDAWKRLKRRLKPDTEGTHEGNPKARELDPNSDRAAFFRFLRETKKLRSSSEEDNG